LLGRDAVSLGERLPTFITTVRFEINLAISEDSARLLGRDAVSLGERLPTVLLLYTRVKKVDCIA
jgi:hypothetical protein